MGSVFERDGVYIVKWRDLTGRWKQKRTSCETKAEAKRLVADLERKVERQALGLEARPVTNPERTFAELSEWWWKEHGESCSSSATIRANLDLHILPALGELSVVEVTPGKIDAMLAVAEKKLSPKTVNNVRALVGSIFNLAMRRERWHGVNPVLAVRKRAVSKRLPNYLRFDEVKRVLAMLDPRWRGIVACALYTGMRKGEILALEKRDVDLEDGTITVGRSWERDTTKGGHADMLPIANELKPYLVAAIEGSPKSPLVFPKVDGTMFRRDVPLDKVLRRALGRAGVVEGYDHRCRRKGCGHAERFPDAEPRRCPKCKMKLWPMPLPRPVRFHDLRHTTATLLLKAGVPIATVQRILRHTDPRITTETYGHLDVEDMRTAVNRLPVGPVFTVVPSPKRTNESQLGAPVVRNGGDGKLAKKEARNREEDSGPTELRGWDLNPGPSGYEQAPSPVSGQAPADTASQLPDNTVPQPPTSVDAFARCTPFRTPFGAPVVRGKCTDVSLPENLLTVREVAERLRVSRATIYALVELGRIPHVRIGNQIRISESALIATLGTAIRR